MRNGRQGCQVLAGLSFVLSGQPDILVGLFSWPGYDGGSRENVAFFGARPRKKKTVLPLPPMTMFELVEAWTSYHKRSCGIGAIVGLPAKQYHGHNQGLRVDKH